MLDKQKMQKIYSIHKQMQSKFRDVPNEGVEVNYLGKTFIVYSDVFWPSEDSKALVKNYVVNQGEEVLDLCTGSGVIAIFSALKGAKKVLSVDVSPNAIKSARENAKRYGVESIIEVRLSDMFSAIKDKEKFDIITMNPPFTPHKAKDYAGQTVWDSSLHVQDAFFAGVDKHLKKGGRIYMTQAQYGAVEEMKRKANEHSFIIRLIGKNKVDEDRIFYAFKLKKI